MRPRRLKSRPGDIRRKKLRMVCAKCNNGWMSRLQNKVKGRLLPFIQGRYAILSDADHRLLAAWSIMFTMVIEFIDPDTAAITPEERRNFSQIAVPNNRWAVWFGRSNDFPPWEFVHYGWFYGKVGDNKATNLGGKLLGPRIAPSNNSQTTTARIGRLLLHTYSSRQPAFHINPAAFSRKHGLKLIWPLPMVSDVRTRTKNLASIQVINVAWDLVGKVVPEYPKPDSVRPKLNPMLPILRELNRRLP